MAVPSIVIKTIKSAAATLETLYTVPAARRARIHLFVAEQSGTGTSIRVALQDDGAAVTTAMYLRYDAPIAGNGTDELCFLLSATDVLGVYATLATVNFVASIYEDDIPT